MSRPATNLDLAVDGTGALKRWMESLKTGARIVARNRLAVVGAVIILLALLGTLVAPYLTPYDPDQPNLGARLAAPSAEHWMGTDRVGRDILSRVLAGLRVTMKVAAGAVVVAVLIGVPLGATSGYAGGGWDALVMRLMDALMAFPSRLLAIALVAVRGASIYSLWLAIGVTAIPKYARLIRGGVLAQKQREYVEAARATGESFWSVLFRHILPNCLGTLMVQIPLDFAHAILVESSLSFLGLGLAPPTISWGLMLKEAQSYMEFAPWTAIFPGLAISIIILGFNLFGDGLRDIFDPRQHDR